MRITRLSGVGCSSSRRAPSRRSARRRSPLRSSGPRAPSACFWLGWYGKAGERIHTRGDWWGWRERIWYETSWVNEKRLNWSCGWVYLGGRLARLIVGSLGDRFSCPAVRIVRIGRRRSLTICLSGKFVRDWSIFWHVVWSGLCHTEKLRPFKMVRKNSRVEESAQPI